MILRGYCPWATWQLLGLLLLILIIKILKINWNSGFRLLKEWRQWCLWLWGEDMYTFSASSSAVPWLSQALLQSVSKHLLSAYCPSITVRGTADQGAVVSLSLSFFLHLKKIFFPFIFISWMLITLQYCSGFKKCKAQLRRQKMGGSGWGIHVYPRLIHVNVWQNHYNIVK